MEPKAVFDIFAQINQVPRPSKHEERISKWLQDFAASHHIECVADEAMNVIMRVPATPGYENHEGVILQAHMDMVCEKNGDVQHDFMTDPIQTYVDGEWLKAKGTTLGADNGIGIAMALAAITDPDLQHPAIECLFTVDEETGLTGAMKLQDGMLASKRLINLDSEDDGQIFIGCAGGIDTLAKMHYEPLDKSQISNLKSQIALEAHDTICRNVANRVQRLQDFARQQDLVIFVGGAKSSNARVLYKHCLEANPNTIFISSPSEIDEEMENGKWKMENPDMKVGICGATSTPLWLMEQVRDQLTNLHQ